MRRLRLSPVRLAAPMARSPVLFAMVGLLVTLLGATGLARYSVDSGQDLLVGRNSTANQSNQRFTQRYGTDPIVIVFGARNPTAFYRDRNIVRLSALEDDLNHDPRVASALGPGTVANSLVNAAHQEEQRILNDYGYFIAELLFQRGEKDTTNLQKANQSAKQIFAGDVLRAAIDAETARQAEIQRESTKPRPTDRVLDTEELAAEQAVARDLEGDAQTSLLPPFFANFLNPTKPDLNAAKQLFQTVTAAYGDCDPDLASLVAASVAKFQPTCRYLTYRALLDLPNCPLRSARTFCQPKSEWAAVLPRRGVDLPNQFPQDCSQSPQDGCSYAILTVRLKPGVAEDRAKVDDLLAKINSALTKHIPSDDYVHQLQPSQQKALTDLGPLIPTECGGLGQANDRTCYQATNDAPMSRVVAGAAPLGFGVASAMQRLLVILVPVALLLMLILLIATFKVRGRVWPLVSAACATALTFGLCLYLGTPLTPAVLAGVPVLVGLGVDYAVQLVARYAEARSLGADIEKAAHDALGRTGPATLLAATATIVGLLGLGLATGVDGGPFVAIPLIAQFAVVVAGGVALSWIAAVFVATPLAILADRRGRRPAPAAVPEAATPHRILGIAARPARVLVPAVVLGLLGWALLPSTQVETDTERLLAPTLPELQQVNLVRAQTGYANEVDVFIEGPVTGPATDPKAIPDNVIYQCELGDEIARNYRDQVASTTTIADFFTASRTSPSKQSLSKCSPPPQPGTNNVGGQTPQASPSPGTGSPSPGASPTSRRRGVAVLSSREQPALAAGDASPSSPPTPVGSGSPRPGGSSSSPSASASPGAGSNNAAPPKTQTPLLCDLRLFPLLSRTLVMDIPADVAVCPGVDRFQNTFISADGGAIDPDSARVVVGMRSSSVADEARVVDGIRGIHAPAHITATPAGIATLAAVAYGTITSRSLFLNLFPLLLVALILFVIVPQPRRAVLALLPTVLAAGWAPLLVRILGLLPGSLGRTLGTLNPLTVVLGALVVALATEFSVVLLGRFYEEIANGLGPDAAAAAALAGVGRAIRVSALTLGGGFAVLALSAFLPNSLPLLSAFGVAVIVDLGLAVGAVFLVMFPLAIAWERVEPVRLSTAQGGSMPVGGAFGMTGSQQVSTYVVAFIIAIGMLVLGLTLSWMWYLAIIPLVIILVATGLGAPSPAPLRAAPAGVVARGRPADATPARLPTSSKARRRAAAQSRAPVAPATEAGGGRVSPGHEAGEETALLDDVPLAATAEPGIPPATSTPRRPLPEPDLAGASPAVPGPRSRRVPGMSGRRRAVEPSPAVAPAPEEPPPKRRPSVSGRSRRPVGIRDPSETASPDLADEPGVVADATSGSALDAPASGLADEGDREPPSLKPDGDAGIGPAAGDAAPPGLPPRPRSRRRRPPPGVRRRDRDPG